MRLEISACHTNHTGWLDAQITPCFLHLILQFQHVLFIFLEGRRVMTLKRWRWRAHRRSLLASFFYGGGVTSFHSGAGALADTLCLPPSCTGGGVSGGVLEVCIGTGAFAIGTGALRLSTGALADALCWPPSFTGGGVSVGASLRFGVTTLDWPRLGRSRLGGS